MYTVSRGPTRIMNRTRRDITQNLEKLEVNRELIRKNSGGSDDSDHIIMSSPRPTFQTTIPIKGQRSSNGRPNNLGNLGQRDTPPPLPSQNHVDTVNYFKSLWMDVQQDIMEDSSGLNGHDHSERSRIIVYEETDPHPALKDFKPFELEQWWGKRLYRKLTED